MEFTLLKTMRLLALLGAFLYAIGDVLLLASKVNIDEYPKLKPITKLLSDSEKMIEAMMLVKRTLPQFVRDWTEGAGFNISYLAFFAFTTITLWK